ncbi:VWA domain-containing protein [Amycolatopsis sp. GM8]|uniref:substrate-binding and vWA domain-containing protein n=1 Tax=Amycolatopsis sp. GM8 TaxID=2896530 RepID=UPI001F1F51C7|nr:VWA domain-containing protein [Amycolatopsis sp. GM8]
MSRLRRFGIVALAIVLALAGCTSGGGDNPQPTPSRIQPGPPTTLRVLAGSELADMQPILDEAAKATGVTVQLTYTGSLDGAQTVANGQADGKYDAVWFSSLRYMETIPEAKQRLAGSARIMGSPVVIGVRESVAKRLGWDHNPVTWSDIQAAARNGQFTFAMTDPSVSNTGFSALVAVASALDGSGRALDSAAIDRVSPALKDFFAGQRLTAGSSDWLTDAFLRRDKGTDPGPPLDGLINYESSLLEINRAHKTSEPLVLVYPRDGVVSADYPLTLLAAANDTARAAQQRLADYLRTPDVQKSIVDKTARRPAIPGVPSPPEAPSGLVEIPFPDTRIAIDALLNTFFDRIRRPARTVYVLDVSGSMAGPRLASLQQALTDLTGVNTSLSGQYCRFRGREEVELLPFSSTPGQPKSFTVDEQNPQPARDAIRGAVQGLRAAGDTAVYDSLVKSYDLLAGATDQDHFLSIVLMTDGENNRGRTLADFQAFVAARGASSPVRVFPIIFGEAAAQEMQTIATVTGGQVWDARNGDLATAFCQIRGYQ